MLTPVRLRGSELRVGDLYVTASAPAIKRTITAPRPTVAPVGGALAAAVELRCADGTTPLVLADQGVRAERDLRPLGSVTSAQRHEVSAAHAEGLHGDVPREFLPRLRGGYLPRSSIAPAPGCRRSPARTAQSSSASRRGAIGYAATSRRPDSRRGFESA